MLDEYDNRHHQNHRTPGGEVGRVRVAFQRARQTIQHVEAARVNRIACQVTLQILAQFVRAGVAHRG